ncbi:hypothetical protein Acsp03_01040 [Actinomadura sp. NBRC 104412]|nr:hypothetical protein Acsp03_01040 [Actinomadura sp. NBRC 104412]
MVAKPELELKVLVDGRPGAQDAEVSWVHNTELPDPSPYLRDGELVLTNGLWHTGPVSSRVFVEKARGAGAAGIVFGLREEQTTTPPDLVEACRTAGLPLMEISVRVPFTKVSQAAAAQREEVRQRELVSRLRLGNTLAAAISRAGASGVLDVLRRDHDLPLAVVDRMARPLAAAGADLDDEQLQSVARALTRHPPPLEIDLGAAGRATVFIVSAIGNVDAALVCLRPAHLIGRAEQAALQDAARLLGLEVAKQQALAALQTRFASELLEMILSGPQRAGEVAGRLQAFGIGPGPLAVAAVAFADGDTATLPGLAEAINEVFVAEATPAIVTAGTQDAVAFWPWRHADRHLARMGRRLVDVVDRRFPGRRPVVGLGEIAADAVALRQPLLQAREACRALLRRPDGPRVAAFGELGIDVLMGAVDPGTLRRLADTVLKPIREHDRAHGGDLERTLRVFFDNDGHRARTAAELHVHVNTVTLRFAKIRKLTDLDVGTTAGFVELSLALEADVRAP